ncbi:MAG: hypothetical protein KC544_14025 [Gemmatimonadetes bacterium]|nr:hypothetical protein [Gemmatimonadota bacterium]
MLRPCPSEDAAGVRACVWDARHMGNGKGRPFLWVRASGGRVVFLTHRQAHSLLRWGA